MTTTNGDLQVTPKSDALAGRQLDVVVSGSIAAVEAVRFLRALRRLHADVNPWLTQGGSQFVTPMALEWASNQTCRTSFSGTATHICTSDAVLVAPASSNIITMIANGQTDTPATAMIASALGQGKDVFILPAMHDSLSQSPSHIHNLKTIAAWEHIKILSPRLEEGKHKFPDPAILADQIAHALNQPRRPKNPVLLTMGTTRGYIDDIRYISNYSSGKLGSVLGEELYRQGFSTHVVCGPCEFKPQVFSTLDLVTTHQEMLKSCHRASADGLSAGIFAAAVLDFEPIDRVTGKISSAQKELQVVMHPTSKIIAEIDLKGRPKIGFKLEVDLTKHRAIELGQAYCAKYNLSALIANRLDYVGSTRHFAWTITPTGKIEELTSKEAIAQWIISAALNFE